MPGDSGPKLGINFLKPKEVKPLEGSLDVNQISWSDPLVVVNRIKEAYKQSFPEGESPLKKERDVSKDSGDVQIYLRSNFKTLGPILFNRARETYGKERVAFASALVQMGEIIGEDRLRELLDILIVPNESSINNLIATGLEQSSLKSKLKRPLEVLKALARKLREPRE